MLGRIARSLFNMAQSFLAWSVDLFLFWLVAVLAAAIGILPASLASLVGFALKTTLVAFVFCVAGLCIIVGWHKYGRRIVHRVAVWFGRKLDEASYADYANAIMSAKLEDLRYTR